MLCDIFADLPSESAVLSLINQFEKMLKKYARSLEYEDAFWDLQLFFIELVLTMKNSGLGNKCDAIIVQYISTSVYNQYIKLSKLNRKRPVLFSELSEEQYHVIEGKNSVGSSTDGFQLLLSGNFGLTNWEKRVLCLIYVDGMTASEVASKTKKSRQAVNQAKRRGMKKIKENL